jgi:hypothetical protein
MGPKEFPPNGGERWNPEMGIFETWNPTEKQKERQSLRNTIWNKVTLSESEKIDDRTTCVACTRNRRKQYLPGCP